MQRLPSILSLDVVCDLSDADMQRIAGESPEMIMERKRVTQKLSVLQDGLAQLTQLDRGASGAMPEK